jgi:hypothetical protein
MRNKMVRLLFLPIAMLLWIIGWAMLWTGTPKEQETQQTQAETTSQDEFITIIPGVPEVPEQCEA